MAILQQVQLWQHSRLRSQLEVNIPKRAFAGASMEIIHSGEGFDRLDETTRERLTAFAQEILACDCQGAPFCGHPERRFVRYLLELRAEGQDPETIVQTMRAEYQLEAYPGDILSLLDESVRRLEAIESLAAVDGNTEAEAMAQRARDSLVGAR